MLSKTIQNIRSYYGGIHKFITYGNGSLNTPISSTQTPIEAMVIHGSNVGIGTNMPTQSLDVRGNIVCSNISVIGDFVTLNTITSNTEQMVIENAGTGPALKVTQSGNNSVAEFYDKESGVALYVGNNGNVGIGTTIPIENFHVNGNILTSGKIENSSGRPMLNQTGGVLQVQNAIVSTTSSASGTILTLNITPSSTSSKILLYVTIVGERAGGTTSSYAYVHIRRNGVNVVGSVANAMGYQVNTNVRQGASVTYLDSPATTSSIAYTFYADHTYASGILFYWHNISLTAMEIAG